MIDECYIGDVRDGLQTMIDAGLRAQTCVTSPPYWGLRDYGADGQIGLESSPAEYVATMVEVFRLVGDVLADDGTLWLNLGDCYATGAGGVGDCPGGGKQGESWKLRGKMTPPNRMPIVGLKPKDLVGQPWRVAMALQADGWYLRSDIIWHKPNPMPESINDRPTKSHEYLFLLSKQERYYYDADAISEPASVDTHARQAKNGIKAPDGRATHDGGHGSFHKDGREKGKTRKMADAPVREVAGAAVGASERKHNCRVKNNASFDAAMAVMPLRRNKRTVWTIPTQAYADAHFATFPEALVEPCILAGSRPGDIVLDPFMGSGTTAMVAQSLGRRWLGCELNPAYVAMQKRRAAQTGIELHVLA